MAFHKARFARIDFDDAWGVAVWADDMPLSGTIVTVTKRNGETQEVRIAEVLTSRPSNDGTTTWWLCRMARSVALRYGAPVNDQYVRNRTERNPHPPVKGKPLPEGKGRGNRLVPRPPRPKMEATAVFREILEQLVGKWHAIREIHDLVGFCEETVRRNLRRAEELGLAKPTKRKRHSSENPGQPGTLWKLTKAGLAFVTEPSRAPEQ